MFLAWKELGYYKAKYGLITGILILLIFMVLFLGGLANGLSDATSSAIRKSNADYFVISENSDEIITRSDITSEQYDEIKQIASDTAPFNLQRLAICKLNDSTKIDCTYLAVEPDNFMMTDIKEGAVFTGGEYEIILNDSFYDEGIFIGDTIKDSTTGIEMKVIGYTKDESYGHSSIGVMTLDTYRAIRNEITNSEKTSYHAIAVKGENINLESIENVEGISVLDKESIIAKIPGHSQEQMTIKMILIVLLVVSATILGVFFYVITIQKLSQFGTLKAIGTPMSKIFNAIVCQVFIISGISAIIGDLLTFFMASMLPNSMPFTISIVETIAISIVFVLISIICSLFTLIKVVKVDPIVAIGGKE